jgi:hypothetical protein
VVAFHPILLRGRQQQSYHYSIGVIVEVSLT